MDEQGKPIPDGKLTHGWSRRVFVDGGLVSCCPEVAGRVGRRVGWRGNQQGVEKTAWRPPGDRERAEPSVREDPFTYHNTYHRITVYRAVTVRCRAAAEAEPQQGEADARGRQTPIASAARGRCTAPRKTGLAVALLRRPSQPRLGNPGGKAWAERRERANGTAYVRLVHWRHLGIALR